MKILPLYCLLLLSVVPCGARAQSVKDLGLSGGSSVVIMPTTAGTLPESHMRATLSRLSLFRPGVHGMSSCSIIGGLSANTEIFLKYDVAETASPLSQMFFGVGGKIVLPVESALFQSVALWGELSSSSTDPGVAYFPSNIVHMGITVAPMFLRAANVNFFAGFSRMDNDTRILSSLNGSIALSQVVKLGGEIVVNYYLPGDLVEAVALTYRPLENISFQFAPGRYQGAGTTSMSFSFGISFTTASIDFLPAAVKPKQNSTTLPSFDELQKELNGGKQEEKKDKQ